MQQSNRLRASIVIGTLVSIATASREALTQTTPMGVKRKHSSGSVQISMREGERGSVPRPWWKGGNVENGTSEKGIRRLARNRELLSRMG